LCRDSPFVYGLGGSFRRQRKQQPRGRGNRSAGQAYFQGSSPFVNPVDQKVLYETSVVQGTFRIDPVAPKSYFINIKALGFQSTRTQVS